MFWKEDYELFWVMLFLVVMFIRDLKMWVQSLEKVLDWNVGFKGKGVNEFFFKGG